MIKSLNTFRALAFFAVFLFHTGYLNAGYLGVQAFFVLSGFLITPILLDMKISKISLKLYLQIFLGRRFLRIFPAYYLFLLILIMLGFIINYKLIPFASSFYNQLGHAITYTYNYIVVSPDYERNSLIAHLWSLAIEEQFYIFWPFFIYFIDTNQLKKQLIHLILLGPIIRIIIGLIIKSGILSAVVATNKSALAVYILPFSYFDSFAVGGYFSLYVTRQIRIRWILTLAFVTVLLGLILEYNATKRLNLSGLGYMPVMYDSLKYIWAYSLFNFIFAMLLYKMKKREFFFVIFENNIFNYLGKISYGLYLYHFPIIAFVDSYLSNSHTQPFVHFTISLTITIIISVISYHLFELKLLKLKNKLFPL